MAAIFWLSSQPRPLGEVQVPDKPAHFAAYAVLGALLWWAAAPAAPTVRAIATLGIGWGYGALDEVHQAFVSSRTGAFSDWLADAAGVTAVVIFAVLWRRTGQRLPGRRLPSAGPRSRKSS